MHRRAAGQRIVRACEESRRAWWILAIIDAFIAMVVAADGASWGALLWWLGMQVLQGLRWRCTMDVLSRPEQDPDDALARMGRTWAWLGMGRGFALILAALLTTPFTLMLVTLVTMAIVAGSVATSAGSPELVRRWTLPTFTALIAVWFLQMVWRPEVGWLGLAVGLLSWRLLFLLNGYANRVTAQNEGMTRTALELEQERNLLARANRAVTAMADQLRAERDRVTAQNEEIKRTARELEQERNLLAQANHAVTEMADKLRAERDRVAAADESKTRFLAAASHDLRQPLFALSLNTSALADVGARLRDPQLDRIESGLRRALDQCHGMLDPLLDIARLDSGTVDVRLESVDVVAALGSARATGQAMAHAKGLAWRFVVEPGQHWARTDEALLERLIGNLLQNAAKFTVAGEIGLEVKAGGDRVELVVFDTGHGIAREDQVRVFDEFYRCANPGRDVSLGLGMGMGLGLFIVRRLAKFLTAELRLDSEVGRGTRVSVALPRATEKPRPRESVEIGAAPPRDHGRSVLVIDDEVTLLDDLRLLLEGKGWRVLAVSTPDQAREAALAASTIDVVLADYRLANGRTGLEAIDLVRAVRGGLPAVIVTGDTAPSRIAETATAGLPVLHKPVNGDDLDRALHGACDQGMALTCPG